MRPTPYLFFVLVFVVLIEDLQENLEIENANQPLTPEEVARIAHISQRLVNNLKKFLGHLDYVSVCTKIQSTPFYQPLNPLLTLTISQEIIATIIATVMAAIKNQNSIPATFVPLPTISSRPDNIYKIAHAKSCLIISKKAHNLMNKY